jgi:hypothetical protein
LHFVIFKESIPLAYVARAKIFSLLRSPRINSKESIPSAYVAGTSNRESIPGLLIRFINSGSGINLSGSTTWQNRNSFRYASDQELFITVKNI